MTESKKTSVTRDQSGDTTEPDALVQPPFASTLLYFQS